MKDLTLVLCRGLPGSGKTTLARFFEVDATFAADDYFEKDGGYDFDPKKLSEAHGWCMERTADAMEDEEPLIVVHNSFSRRWEADEYFRMAEVNGYSVFVVEAQNAFGNVHGVPDAIVEAMLPRGGSVETDGSLMEKCGHKGPTKALVISVSITARYHADNGDEHLGSQTVHLVFERPTNYTKVWAAKGMGYALPDPTDFVMLSDHDSCWRCFDTHLFDTRLEVRKLDGLDKLDGASRKRIRDYNTIERIAWYTIEYEAVDDRGYKKMLTRLDQR